MNRLDPHTSIQISNRLKSLFDSARRYQQRRSRPLIRSITPRNFPQERQLELGLQLER
ncbi:MAG: hypothetical protein GWQ05_19305 [Verrucomicrobiaceae bacterium]|jgi:hypothetical protein|nr:hypothetical protein [Verrucomicrobiales bacterium]MDB2347275.1 hypothetical protein [Verrucomicrobiales bacterium]MDF1784881.1 hypothetical protein [Verrucomicrobiales bacterium]NCF93076.1 hypothetical protein [Verrucomicrobiaceae bacterium]